MTLIVQSHVTNLTPGMERSTLASAGRSAETNGDRMARGLPGRCVRGRFKHLIRPEDCAADFLAEVHDCARDGGCTTGRIMSARYKEEIMASSYGRCRVATCPNSKKRVLLPALGLCATCYKADLAARKRGPAPALVDDLTPKEIPIIDQEEVAAMSTALSASGQDETTENAQESSEIRVAAGQDVPTTVSAQDVTCHDPAAEAAARSSDPVEIPVNMATVRELVLDTSRPFSLNGIEFDPAVLASPTKPPLVHISKIGNLHISKAAHQSFDLGQYVSVCIIPSKDKSALALVFSAREGKGFRRLTADHSSQFTPKASAREIKRSCPEIVGRKLLLSATDTPGAFVAVVTGDEVAA